VGTKSKEVEVVLRRVRRKMRVWGITVTYLARHIGVSRQYGWQSIHYRTRISLHRAEELERSVERIIQTRQHLVTFGQRLRAARLASGLTLKQVAERIGYSWVGVERWEKDICLPKPGVLWHLLSVYRLDAEVTGIHTAFAAETLPAGRFSRRPRGVQEELLFSLRNLGMAPFPLHHLPEGTESMIPRTSPVALKRATS
jgi:transcriptional regulator with XRE-family HTH domain